MTARCVVVALVLSCVACRETRSAHDSARAAAPPIDTVAGCRQTAGVRPDTGIGVGSDAAERWQRTLARGVEFSCVIAPGTRMRFVVAGDTSLPSVDSIAVYADAASRRPLQVLSLEEPSTDLPQPYITDYLSAIDLDADGYGDLMLGASWGATGNTSYLVWRFDPRARRFVSDSVLSSVFNPEPVRGRPCIHSFSNSSARDDERALYCLRAGRWQIDSLEQHVWDREHDVVVHSIHARRGDSLVVVKSETVRDEQQ